MIMQQEIPSPGPHTSTPAPDKLWPLTSGRLQWRNVKQMVAPHLLALHIYWQSPDQPLRVVSFPCTPALRLHIVEARALSMLGAVEPTRRRCAPLSSTNDELQDGTRAELGFPAARKALSIGTAYVGLGMGDDAEPAAGQALELYLAADPELVGV